MQKRSSKISLKNTKNIKLSIQFSLDGFSFCISDSSANKTVFFASYIFDKTLNTPEELLIKIQEIFKENKNLQLDFSSILVIHQNNLSTLVPNKYFREDLMANYLNYNIKTLKTDLFAFDDVQAIDAKNVYIPYVNINNYIFQNFGEFEFKHHKSVLIEKLLQLPLSLEKKMYVDVSKSTFDIIVTHNKLLLFSNSFTYDTNEDFLYYILFVAEQLEMNTEMFQLYFTGDIEENSELYKISYTYIKNIFFLESNNPIFKVLNLSKHTNYILLD
ncbi:hypothetical protein BTO18_05890 [Polaribacter porphyrae]|uniref:DUF3822 domain-containing protein n=1 Tax=Polaribacter porphyrae TaxID=1137780 RepID=A0A2S7WTY1_9FLAO|nr:hypothetical protein BTO18_05890 [Polaribacter porphyrae]